jgi:hypothetical protein
MTEPLVCAIMLTRDRPEMAARAVRSFRAQTYGRRSLLIFDTGVMPDKYPEYEAAILYHHEDNRDRPIGVLRNDANGLAVIGKTPKEIDIFVHWDSDDISHPNRITEQVALLQSSGADAVGYREMLFWRTNDAPHKLYEEEPDTWTGDQAYLFTHPRADYVIGTSLCYWRKTWERKPFKSVPHSQTTGREDSLFCQGLKVASVSAMVDRDPRVADHFGQPRMIASIHSSNTMPYDVSTPQWKRVPEWDAYCRKEMTL